MNLKTLLLITIIIICAANVQAKFTKENLERAAIEYEQKKIDMPDSANFLFNNKKVNLKVDEDVFGYVLKNMVIAEKQSGGYDDASYKITTSYDILDKVNKGTLTIDAALRDKKINVEGVGAVNTAIAFLLKNIIGFLFRDIETDFNLNDVPCIISTKTEIVPQDVQVTETTDNEVSVPKGYDIAVSPFKVECSGEQLELTLNVPNTFTDIKALKCKEGVCGQAIAKKVTQLECGDKITEKSREEEYLSPDMFPVKISQVELEVSNEKSYLESGNAKIEVLETVDGVKLSLAASTGNVRQPENQLFKILSTPITVGVSGEADKIPVKITLPYVVDPEIDVNSVAIYSKLGDSWEYIGGDINKDELIVTATIADIKSYVIESQAQFSLLGTICNNCEHSSLENIYTPVGNDIGAAVFLVHGLGSSPSTFNDIINDIRLTRQPWQAWTFSYPSQKSNLDNAKDFADEIEKNSKNLDDIYIVAHSLGGIISQHMLNYAYNENKKYPTRYTFIAKVRKAIIIGSPNDKVKGNEIFQTLFKYLVNAKTKNPLFDMKSRGVSELLDRQEIPQVPSVEYYVIAGTRGYQLTTPFFTINSQELFDIGEKNDGIVTVKSAQHIGNEYLDDQCNDYWEINESHTAILDNPVSRAIIEKIVAKEILKDIKRQAILGNNKYFKLHVKDCSPNDKYVVIGKKIKPKKAEDATKCSCGNGYCNVGEDEVSCPSDCASIFTIENFYIGLPWFITAFVLILIVGWVFHKKKKGVNIKSNK